MGVLPFASFGTYTGPSPIVMAERAASVGPRTIGARRSPVAVTAKSRIAVNRIGGPGCSVPPRRAKLLLVPFVFDTEGVVLWTEKRRQGD